MYEHKAVALDALIPYALNSRTHSDAQVAQLAASIREFGFTNPVLIDEANNLIAGHGRVLAARKLGLTEVPAIVVTGMDDRKRRALIIADNKLALNAGWDEQALRVELEDLAGEFGELMGFSEDELAALLAEASVEEGLTDEDDVPEVADEPVTKPGDVWVMGKHRLMCGDSTMLDQVERVMAGEKADMIFTDPPYGVDYEGINNDSRAGLADLLQQVFANYVVTAKPGAPVYVFHSDRCADIFHQVFREHFHFSSMVIWVKPALVLSQTDYQSRHEPCMYGWVEGAAHQWHSDRKQTSVWEFGKEHVAGHTTPKPTEMVAYAIENSSKRGQTVIDLFGGSGSTLIACEKTNRQARLMELDPKYCDVIVKRWQDFTGKQATLEATGQTFAELSSERQTSDNLVENAAA
jgi:DNA modification methylase